MASTTKAKKTSTPPVPPVPSDAKKETAPAKSKKVSKIKVVFNGDSRGLADCNINGQGYNFPVGEPVEVEQVVADVIGNYTVVGGETNE